MKKATKKTKIELAQNLVELKKKSLLLSEKLVESLLYESAKYDVSLIPHTQPARYIMHDTITKEEKGYGPLGRIQTLITRWNLVSKDIYAVKEIKDQLIFKP